MFVRYFLILIGFGPLFFIFYNSNLKNKKISIIDKINFLNVLGIILILLSQFYYCLLWDMIGADEVHISYVMTFILFLFLVKNGFIKINITNLKK